MTDFREPIMAAIAKHGPLPATEIVEHLSTQPTHEELYEDLVALEAAYRAEVVPENSGYGDRRWRAAA